MISTTFDSVPVLASFDHAALLYKAHPSAETLLILEKCAMTLLEGKPRLTLATLPRLEWIEIDAPNAFCADFYEIRVTINRRLSDAEVSQAAGAVGYALRETLAGEELGDPHVIRSYRAQQTILICAYDSTKSRRDDPDFETAFLKAEQYVQTGSPVRLTNRAGVGSRGTRLVQGIGTCKVEFAIR